MSRGAQLALRGVAGTPRGPRSATHLFHALVRSARAHTAFLERAAAAVSPMLAVGDLVLRGENIRGALCCKLALLHLEFL